MVKVLIILSYLLMEGFDAFVDHLNDTYIDRELPENVRDVYDEEEYEKWRNYQNESGNLDLISDVIKIVLTLVFLISNAYSWLFRVVPSPNVFVQYLCVVAILTLITEMIEIPFDYYDTFVIEEKYGLNKSTKGTFILDMIKGYFIAVAILYAFIMLIMVIFETFGNLAFIVATAAMVIIMLLIALIIVPLMRIYNKFTPLEEGELRDKLTDLCTKYGMKIRKIVVKDA
nr:hypothetical protein [Lachnospiraceae bacterium]